MFSPLGRVWRSTVDPMGWDSAVLVETAFAGHPATLCWADGEQWVCRDVNQKMEHAEGRILCQAVEIYEKLGKSSVCYSWRTDAHCLHRDTYLCISSKAVNFFLEFKFSPKWGFFSPSSFLYFSFFFFSLFCLFLCEV